MVRRNRGVRRILSGKTTEPVAGGWVLCGPGIRGNHRGMYFQVEAATWTVNPWFGTIFGTKEAAEAYGREYGVDAAAVPYGF